MDVRKLLARLLLVVLVGAVGYGLYVSVIQKKAITGMVTARGLVGSEKIDYLSDPRVLAVFRKNGIDLKVEKAGSREMATRSDLKQYDFAFPAGEPAANKVMQAAHVSKSYTPFFTPMAIASWKPIVDVLSANGIVSQGPDGYLYIVDMRKLLNTIEGDKRWKDLPHNTTYPIGKSVLVTTTDVRKSNSAAMYLALVSYVLNGDNVVQSDSEVAKVMPMVSQLFLKQGFQESSSAGPFEDYLAMGMGKAPLVMIYEAQFIQQELHPGTIRPEMVLLYPKPTIFTKHTLVPLSPAGERAGVLLATDTTLQHLAAEYGLRTSDAAYTADLWKRQKVNVPTQLLDVIDPPSYDVLEQMIAAIEQRASCAPGAAGCPATTVPPGAPK